MIVDVKSIVENKKELLKNRVDKLKENGINPKLVVILASKDEASKLYVSKKRQMCRDLGIEEEEYIFEEDTDTSKIVNLISKLNKNKKVHGILVQLPLFSHLDEKEILNTIKPSKDVDGLHPLNLGLLLNNELCMQSCTPKGIMEIIESLNEDITGKNAVVVGRSILVGKPIANMLLNKGATITMCHSKTVNLKEFTCKADILVVAIGKAKFIKEDMVKENSIVIDVGINRIDGKVVGDVDTENVAKKVKYITKVPGGVGLTTVVSLLDNVILSAETMLNESLS